MSRVHVTGANGFVGAHVVRALRAAGHAVVALVGADRDARNLDGLDVETRPLDVRDESSVWEALADGEALIHTAASYSFWEPDPRSIYRVNVDGTRNVLRAARELGFRKVVHTSSTATLSPQWRAGGARGEVGDETGIFDLSHGFQGHYKSAKVMSELVALRFAAQGLPLVTVHPTAVIGTGDARPTPTGSMIVHFLQGHMKVYAETWLNIVDAADVGEGHRLALERGEPGRGYVLGGENLRMDEVLALLADITGLPAPRFAIPAPLLAGIARIDEWLSDHVTRRPPLVPRESVLHARASGPMSSARAEKELGFRALGARATLEKAVRWFLANGYCPPARARIVARHLA